jgi:hypothetical protein
MKTTFRRIADASPTSGFVVAGLVVAGFLGTASLGCRSGGATSVASAEPTFTPLPPIEREVAPDGSEVVVAPPPDTQAAPKSWTRKFADFCTPKPPPKSASNRVYESDNVPYTD